MSNLKGVNIAGLLVPFTDTDTYPVTDPVYGIGGLREVADTTTRDAIPAERLRQGMLVYSIADDKYFKYTGSGWAEAVIDRLVSVPASSTSTGSVGQYSVDGTFLYVCYATDSWARIALDLTSF